MSLAIGFLLFLLGLVTVWGWWQPAIVIFLKGLVSFSLLFWGLLAMIIGYSEHKAKRQFENAVTDQGKEKASEAETESEEN